MNFPGQMIEARSELKMERNEAATIFPLLLGNVGKNVTLKASSFN